MTSRASRALDGGSAPASHAATAATRQVPGRRHVRLPRSPRQDTALPPSLGPGDAARPVVEPEARPLRPLGADAGDGAASVRGAERRLLAVGPDLEVPRGRLRHAVERDQPEPTVAELERDELHGVRLGVVVEAGRVSRVDRARELPVEVDHHVHEMDAALEERPARHRRAPGSRLVPGRELHRLPHLAEHEPPELLGLDPLAERAEHRLQSVLVVDHDLAAGRGDGGEHTVALLARRRERLLADDVRSRLQRGDADVRVRLRRGRDDDDVGLESEQLVECGEGGRTGVGRPRGAALRILVDTTDRDATRDARQSGKVVETTRAAEPDVPEAHAQASRVSALGASVSVSDRPASLSSELSASQSWAPTYVTA